MGISRHLQRPALVLIVSGQEWSARSIESILGNHGYAVLMAHSGKQAVERITTFWPDALIVDVDLPDTSGIALCAQLRARHDFTAAMPILITCSGRPDRQRRLDALRAGAWDVIGPALDGEELPLRIGTYVQAKLAADRYRDESLIDSGTGLYNLRGVLRRAREVGAQAFRSREALACVAISPLALDDDIAATRACERLAQVIQRVSRGADASGTVGPDTFAVVASGMGDAGVEALVRRISSTAVELFEEPIPIAVGFEAVPNYAEAPIDPRDLLAHAGSALWKAPSEGRALGSAFVRRYASGSLA